MVKRFIRLPEVCRTLGLPKSTLYKLMSEGQFPKSIQLTNRTRAWLEEEIHGWQQERIAASRGEAA